MNLKKLLLLLVSLISLSLFTSCELNKYGYAIFDIEVNSNDVQKDELDSFLSDNYYSYNNIKVNSPDILDNVRNITPSKIDSFCQIYKFNDDNGILNLETFLFYNDKFYHLGAGFGGFGVTEFAYIDSLDSKKLYYIFSCGSGFHQSRVGCFNFIDETNNVVDVQFEGQIDIQFALSSNATSLDIYSSDFKYKKDRFEIEKNKRDLILTNLESYDLILHKENLFSKSEWMNSNDKRELIDIFINEHQVIGMKYEELKFYLGEPDIENEIVLEIYPPQFGGYEIKYLLYEENEYESYYVRFFINQQLIVESYSLFVRTE